MDVDIRYLPEQDPGELLAQIRSLPDVHVARSFIWPPARVSPHEPVRARALPGGVAADRRRVDERRPRRRLRRGGVPEGRACRRSSSGRRGGGHHGPDEWVSIDSLARYRRALVDFARSVPERFASPLSRRAARRGGRPGVKSPDRPPRPGRGVLIRALLGGDPDDLAVGDRGRLRGAARDRRRRRRVHGPRRAARSSRSRRSTGAEAGDPRTFLILGTDERYADRQLEDQAALGHDPARARGSRHQAHRRDVAPARPEGQRSPARARTRSTPPTRSAGRARRSSTIKKLFEDATGENFPINNVISGQLRRLPARGELRRRRLRRHRPPLLQRQHDGGGRRGLRDDRRRSPATRGSRARTRSTTSATATSTTTSSAPRASRTSCARSPTRTASAQLLDVGKRKELAHVFGKLLRGRRLLRGGLEPDRRWRKTRPLHGAVARRPSTRSASRPTRPRTRRSTATCTSRTPTCARPSTSS